MGKIIKLETLRRISEDHVNLVRQRFVALDESSLTTKPSSSEWSPIEIIQHLNETFSFYLPKIEKAKKNLQRRKSNSEYKLRWLINYFSSSQRPKNGKRKFKIKTFTFLEPPSDLDTGKVIQTYEDNHKEFRAILTYGLEYDLSSTKINSAIGPTLKFKIHEALDFLMSHEARHQLQLEETIKKINLAKGSAPD